MKIVFEKWKTQLRLTIYGMSFGSTILRPKITTDKMSKIMISEHKWTALFSLIFILFIQVLIYSFGMNEGFWNVLRMIIKISSIGSCCFYFVGKFKMYKSTFNTTFSEVYNRKFPIVIAYALGFVFNFYEIAPDNANTAVNSITLFLSLILLFNVLITISSLIKHYKLKQKYQIN